jgi:hypothetical protein
MTGIGTTDKSSHVKTAVKISGVCSRFAASIRTRQRRDGTVYTSVLYTRAGKQTSTSFNDHGEALRFQDLCNRLGSAEALKIWGRPPHQGHTVVAKSSRSSFGYGLGTVTSLQPAHFGQAISGVTYPCSRPERAFADKNGDGAFGRRRGLHARLWETQPDEMPR